jgi:hypothetical protein
MKIRQLIRDLFLTGLALAILYQQVFVAAQAQAILIFLVIFLLGSVPVLRGDTKDEPGVFARFIMSMLGVHPDGYDSSSDDTHSRHRGSRRQDSSDS